MCVSVHECECAYACVSARVWTSMYLCGVSHLKVCLCFRGGSGGVGPCMCLCVCVCLHQTVPVTSGLADTQPLSLQPRFLHPPFCESHRWERQERKNNRGERQFWGLQISDCPEFSPCLLLCLHSCRTFFCPSMIVYMCVCVSLSPAISLCLRVSVSLVKL